MLRVRNVEVLLCPARKDSMQLKSPGGGGGGGGGGGWGGASLCAFFSTADVLGGIDVLSRIQCSCLPGMTNCHNYYIQRL